MTTQAPSTPTSRLLARFAGMAALAACLATPALAQESLAQKRARELREMQAAKQAEQAQQPAPQADTSAQTPEARALLERASAAIAGSGKGRAQFVLSADAPGMFASMAPSGQGQVAWTRSQSTAEGEEPTPSAMRIGGTYKNAANAAETQLDYLVGTEVMQALDHEKKEMVENRAGVRRPDTRFAPLGALNLAFLIAERPLTDELNAYKAEVVGQETIDGVPCSIVEVQYREDNKPGTAGGANKARIAVAEADGLPRRIDHITESQLGNMAMTVAFRRVEPNADLPASAFAMSVPEGYAVKAGPTSTLRSPRGILTERRDGGEATTTEGRDGEAATPDRGRPAGGENAGASAVANPAPAFTLTDAATGKSFTNDSQRGRVTVLYFWGTWCVPCREYSPLVSTLASDSSADGVDVLGVAVRERDPAAARAYAKDKGYAHTVVDGGDQAARAFKVRVYPTIILVGKDGGIIDQWRPDPQSTPEELMGVVAAKVKAAAAG